MIVRQGLLVFWESHVRPIHMITDLDRQMRDRIFVKTEERLKGLSPADLGRAKDEIAITIASLTQVILEQLEKRPKEETMGWIQIVGDTFREYVGIVEETSNVA